MIIDDGSTDQELTAEMMRVMASIHDRAASCMIAIEGVVEEDPPPDLSGRLALLRSEASGFVATFVPDAAVGGPQPVAFDDDLTGWDFDPWMVEKTGSIERGAVKAHEEWVVIERRWRSGDRRPWAACVDLDSPPPRPPTEREWVLLALHEVRRKAGIVFEMLDERLIAVLPGRPW